MPEPGQDPLDHLRNQEEHPLEHFDGPSHELGHSLGHEVVHEPEREAEDTVKDQVKDAAKDEIQERAKGAIKKGLKKGGEQAGEEAAQGLGTGAGAGATGAAGTGAAGAAAGAEGAGIAGAAGAGVGAGAASAAGTAGTAGVAGAGTAATGVAGAAGAAGVATAGETAGVGAAVGAAVAGAALVGGYVVKHKAQVAVIALVGIMTVMVGGMLLLSALRPIASTLSAAQKYLAPVQQIVDNRSTSILARFVTGGASVLGSADQPAVAAASTGEGQVLGVTSDGLVTGGALRQLFDAMKKDGFEGRIKNNFGLEFKSNGAGGGVQIVQHGTVLGIAHDASQAEKILREDFPDYRRLMDEELRGWDWAQHIKIARPAKSFFSIPGLAIPGAESATSPAQLADVVKSQIGTILQPGINGLRWAMSCFLTGQGCSQDTSAKAGVTAVEDYQDNQDASIERASQAAYDNNMKAITPETNYATVKLTDTTHQRITDAIANDGLAVIMLGWLDLATTIYKGADDPAYSHVTSDLRSKQAGALFLWNLSAVNQSGAGDASSPSSSLIFRSYANIEESQAYNYVAYDDTGRGKPMGEDEKVNSMLANPMSAYLNSFRTIVSFTPLKLVLEVWDKIRKVAGPIIRLASHTSLSTFFTGKIVGLVKNTPLGSFIDNVFQLPSKVLLPVCDPAEKNYNFFNCMGTGAHILANFACSHFGCGKITVAQENQLKYASLNSAAATVANLPLEKRLFDRMQPGSLINVAALKSPVSSNVGENLATAFQGIFATIWSTPKNVASMAAQPAMAASADSSSIDGIEHLGIPLQTLTNTPLAQELFDDSGDCQTKPADQVNMCAADFSTVDALYARYTHNPAYGG